ncbi:MAG: ABC transporter ATP-binding protein [Bacteriovoracaceae bacterium]|nr:ABC transporter ATP-binding protein [Bacteriovoracaceae bacterium]
MTSTITTTTSNQPLLKLDNMSLYFGGVRANHQVTFSMGEGLLYGLIGPNGAGKSTIFNVITGLYTPTSGDVFFQGESIKGRPSYELAKRGIGRTFQNIRLFKELTVLENVMTSFFHQTPGGYGSALFRTDFYSANEKIVREKSLELLELMGLIDNAEEKAQSLPYGKQRKLEMARALGLNPTLLLLDEPAAGLNPSETKELTNLIAKIQKTKKISVLLIEHDMKLVMEICEKIFVLDYGTLIAEGGAAEIQSNPRVIEAYLGVED